MYIRINGVTGLAIYLIIRCLADMYSLYYQTFRGYELILLSDV